jgi:S-formylglutathione hydrolase
MEFDLREGSKIKAFGGHLYKFNHTSHCLGGLKANFNIFIPQPQPQPQSQSQKTPAIIYLSGLTCNEDNAAQKGCFLESAARLGISIIFPDTSPRGAGKIH